MRRCFRRTIIALAAWISAALAACASAAHAGDASIKYYAVSGRTPMEIHVSMLARGPHVGHDLAYATTTSYVTQHAELQRGARCRFRVYKLKLRFSTLLPRLRNPGALGARDRARWNSFSAFVARHEATHRTIWQKCFAHVPSEVRRLSADSCSQVVHKATRIVKSAYQACESRDRKFDKQQHDLLLRQPFIRSVLRQAGQ